MSLSKLKDSLVPGISDLGVQENQRMMLTAKYFNFIDDKLIKKSEAPVEMEVAERREVASRFIEASVVMMSNPFYEPPIGSLQSMESILKIKNVNEVKDQLR